MSDSDHDHCGVLLCVIVGYLTAGVLWGSRKRWAYSNLEPLLAAMLALALFQMAVERRAIIEGLKKLAKKLTTQSQDKNKAALTSAVAVVIVFAVVRLDSDFFNMLLWWLIYAVCFIGTYRFMGWLECKVVHPEQWKKKTETHFAPKEEALENEIQKKKTQLQTWKESELMSFAHTLVPNDFWDSGKLAVLINQMENKKIDTLSEGVMFYGAEKVSEKQRKLLEDLYWSQALQDEALQQQLHAVEKSDTGSKSKTQ